MDLGLKGKKVILTGGSRGIGRACLELFCEEGCDVAFFSRNGDQVTQTKRELEKYGVRVYGEKFDMSNLETYAEWLRSAAEWLGGCDVFVPGASASGAGATGDWQACFDLDFRGTVIGCETLLPYLEKSDAASVIIMSSTAALEKFVVPQAFNAIKGGLLVYASQLCQDWGPKNIRVNSVSPGPISFPDGNWEMIKSGAPDLYNDTIEKFALGRFGNPVEVANSIVFLSSSRSSYTTGTNLVIDGGFTKRVQF